MNAAPQTVRIWLDEVADRIGSDRQVSWEMVWAGLHKLRESLHPDSGRIR